MSSFSGSFSPGSMPFISGEVSVPRYPKRISLRRRESCKISSASDCTVVYLTLSKSNMSFRYCTIWCCKDKRKVYSKETSSHLLIPAAWTTASREPHKEFCMSAIQAKICFRLGITFVARLDPLMPLKQDSRAPEVRKAMLMSMAISTQTFNEGNTASHDIIYKNKRI